MTTNGETSASQSSAQRRGHGTIISAIAIVTGLVIGLVITWFGVSTSVISAVLATGCFLAAAGFLFQAVYRPASTSTSRRLLLLTGVLIFVFLGIYWLTSGS